MTAETEPVPPETAATAPAEADEHAAEHKAEEAALHAGPVAPGPIAQYLGRDDGHHPEPDEPPTAPR